MVKIRLRRVGSKKQPSFRVVVADSRAPRDGRFIEEIGFYNPRTEPETLRIDEARALYWLSVGAQPSDSAARLLGTLGTLERFDRLKQGESLEALVAEAEAVEEEEAEEEAEEATAVEAEEAEEEVEEAEEAEEAELEEPEAEEEAETEEEAGPSEDAGPSDVVEEAEEDDSED
jgi:small subunit ribosomal protein S16